MPDVDVIAALAALVTAIAVGSVAVLRVLLQIARLLKNHEHEPVARASAKQNPDPSDCPKIDRKR